MIFTKSIRISSSWDDSPGFLNDSATTRLYLLGPWGLGVFGNLTLNIKQGQSFVILVGSHRLKATFVITFDGLCALDCSRVDNDEWTGWYLWVTIEVLKRTVSF